MKNIFNLLLFSLTLNFTTAKSISDLISSFSTIITELFIIPQIPFDVIIYKSKSSKTFDIIDEIGNQLSGKILQISNSSEWNHELTQSAVILTENEKDLKEFLNRTELKNVVAKSLRFLIYSSEKIEMKNLKIPPLTFDRGHIGHFSYFVIETLKEIQLKTFEWFTEKFCDVQQEILINSFDKKKKNWKSDLKIQPKFKNFHNCTLKLISRIYNFPTFELIRKNFPFFNYEFFQTKKEALKPFEIEIANAIARHGNFTNDFHWQGEMNVHIFYLPRFQTLDDDCHVGTIFTEDFETFATTPAESYTSYEKMSFPFDDPTWQCLGATMILALTAIFIIDRTPEWVQDIFYGKRIRNASINLIGLFFGIGQIRLPENNFSRILLMNFSLFFFVLNSAYQGEF